MHPDDAKLERLEKLGELKEKGVLTATEFREEKKKILSG
jgi:Short C-terminal domain